MGFSSLHYLSLLFAVYQSSSQSLFSAVPVKLFLNQNSNIYQVDVKEYLIVRNDDDVIIGCSTSVQQVGNNTNIRITLRNGNHTLKQQETGDERKLLWSGEPFITSNLSCEINLMFLDSGHTSSVIVNDIVIRMRQGLTCFPNTSNNVFLRDEIVQIVCTAPRDGYSWDIEPPASLILDNDQVAMFLGMVRVVRNFVKLSASGVTGSITCSRPRINAEECSIQSKLIRLEESLIISVSPQTFSHSTIGIGSFKCYSNVATEYVSWHVELIERHGFSLEVGPLSDLPWSYIITHYTNESVLTLSADARGIKSVSCSTSRAGYVVMATAKNITSDIIQKDNSENHDTETTCSDNNISVLPYVIAIIILIIVCIVFTTITGYVMYNIIRSKVMASEVAGPDTEMTTKESSGPYDDHHYYAASERKLSCDNRTGDVKVEDSITVETGISKDIEHLSSDILDYGAVIATNDVYEST